MVEFRNGAPIRLGDVAEVKIGHPAPIGDAVINDGDGILLIVEKQPWGNTLDVTTGVEKVLEELKPALPGVNMDSTIFRPATFIQLSIDHLTEALWLGCLLVVVVLALFLGDWRTTIISVTAIPLSLAIALLLLRWRGETINTMILAGLIIALGEVVDDAIIDVENILRRLRQNRCSPSRCRRSRSCSMPRSKSAAPSSMPASSSCSFSCRCSFCRDSRAPSSGRSRFPTSSPSPPRWPWRSRSHPR